MSSIVRLLTVAVILVGLASAAALWYVRHTGLSARPQPGAMETTVARAVRGQQASWHLVHFIRHLPAVTPDELEARKEMNPRPPQEIRQDIEAERFLRGDDTASPGASHVH